MPQSLILISWLFVTGCQKSNFGAVWSWKCANVFTFLTIGFFVRVLKVFTPGKNNDDLTMLKEPKL